VERVFYTELTSDSSDNGAIQGRDFSNVHPEYGREKRGRKLQIEHQS
jgi:hypothetical protein